MDSLQNIEKTQTGNILYPEKYPLIQSTEILINKSDEITINGGYFKDPFKEAEGGWFDYSKEKSLIKGEYTWSGAYIFGGTFGKNTAQTDVFDDVNDFFGTTTNFVDENKLRGLISNDSADKTTTSFIWSKYYNFIDYYEELGYEKSSEGSLLSSSKTKIVAVNSKPIEDSASSEAIKKLSGTLIYKNASSYSSPIRSIISYDNKDNERILDFYTIFDKLIVEIKNEKDKSYKIYFYQIPSFDTDKFEELYVINLDKDTLFKMLYNESDESLYLAELIKNNNKFDLQLNRYTVKDKIIEEKLINTNDDKFSKNNFDLPSEENLDEYEISMSFSYNNDFKKYLLSYIICSSNNMYLYNHTFKYNTKSNFYKSLKSTCYKKLQEEEDKNNG